MRVAVLMHEDLIPPPSVPADHDWANCEWVAEYDVMRTLEKLGHEVLAIGVHDDIRVLRESVERFKPHVTFNLLEEFNNRTFFDQNVVSYLELLQAPYTGCNPRGLMLARDKAIAKKVLSHSRVKTPKFMVFPRNRKVKRPSSLSFPLIVKCLNEEASLGISKASVVHSDEKLQERVEFIHEQIGRDAIVEQFISGREIFVGVMGNYRLDALPPWQLFSDKVEDSDNEFYTKRAKFNYDYQNAKGIRLGPSDVDLSLGKALAQNAKRVYRGLFLNGYARIDFRVTDANEIYLLEANPNPDIAEFAEFAGSAKHRDVSYPELIQKILTLGISWASREAHD